MPELTRIETLEQLNDLPVGSVVRSEDTEDGDTIVMEKCLAVHVAWYETGYRQPVTESAVRRWLPFQLLYRPVDR